MTINKTAPIRNAALLAMASPSSCRHAGSYRHSGTPIPYQAVMHIYQTSSHPSATATSYRRFHHTGPSDHRWLRESVNCAVPPTILIADRRVITILIGGQLVGWPCCPPSTHRRILTALTMRRIGRHNSRMIRLAQHCTSGPDGARCALCCEALHGRTS